MRNNKTHILPHNISMKYFINEYKYNEYEYKYLTARYTHKPRHLRSNNNRQCEQSRFREHNGRILNHRGNLQVVCIAWEKRKKTIARRTARWATSKVSRGRIQPYIGVDTAPRSRSNAQSNTLLGNTCKKEISLYHTKISLSQIRIQK